MMTPNKRREDAIIPIQSLSIHGGLSAPAMTRIWYNCYRPTRVVNRGIGVRAIFFYRGWAIFARKFFRQCPKKTATITCKITLPNSPHPVIISKNLRLRALYLARQNEFCCFSFNKYIFFHFWLLVSAFRRKIMVCPSLGRCSPPTLWLVRLCEESKCTPVFNLGEVKLSSGNVFGTN